MRLIVAVVGLLGLAALACSLPGFGDPTAAPCPEATSEPFWVEPALATTSETSTAVEVYIGHGEAVTVTAESGTFTAQGDFSTFKPAWVEVTLLPGTTHHLEVSATVAQSEGSGGCQYGGYTLRTTRDKDGNPLVIEQGAGPALTPTLCPQATPEPLWVEPIPATTDQLSLTLEVSIGNGEAITVTAESGTFTAEGEFSAFAPTQIEVALLPDTTHHLEVEARVRQVAGPGGCPYGGYTLRTNRDRDGGPLEIEQTGTP